MLTENDVVDAVARYLQSCGYTIESRCNTSQRGIDILAINRASGRRLRVEAKGGTSSKAYTERYGQGFNGGQVKSHVSRALYEAATMRTRFRDDEIILAFPDDDSHRQRVNAIDYALTRLEISVLFVAADGSVRITREPGGC